MGRTLGRALSSDVRSRSPQVAKDFLGEGCGRSKTNGPLTGGVNRRSNNFFGPEALGTNVASNGRHMLWIGLVLL